METVQNRTREKAHYEALYERKGDHHFIGSGYAAIHAQTVRLLPPGARILDVGCGSGHHSRAFARDGYEVTGVELSETALGICRAAFAGLGLPGTFHCGDVRDLPFEDRSFDGAFMSLILHHFLDYEPVLREAARVSNRYVFVFEPNVWNPHSFLLLNVANRFLRPSFLTPNQRAVSPRRVERIMRSAGYCRRATHYATVASGEGSSLLSNLIHTGQRLLPSRMRHNKFVQVYERNK